RLLECFAENARHPAQFLGAPAAQEAALPPVARVNLQLEDVPVADLLSAGPCLDPNNPLARPLAPPPDDRPRLVDDQDAVADRERGAPPGPVQGPEQHRNADARE